MDESAASQPDDEFERNRAAVHDVAVASGKLDWLVRQWGKAEALRILDQSSLTTSSS